MLDKPASSDTETLPLLLLPGTLCDGRVFTGLGHAFDGRAVTVETLAGAASTAEMAAKIIASAPLRFALAGFSLGAIVALEIIAQAPERVERLALIGGNARLISDANAKVRRAALAKAGELGVASYVAEVWDQSVAASNRNDAALRQCLMAMADATSLDAFRAQVEISLDRTDSRPRLPQIAVPTLVMVGAEDRICPPDLSSEMAAAIIGARLAVIDGAGHYVTLEQPRAAARELRRWLDTIPEIIRPQGATMAESKPTKISRIDAPEESVLQVERRDYPELAPTDRPRSQSLDGFDEIYTDIVDYIVRCTHKIWDERDVGLIYTHYTHNCVLYGTMGTIYNREDVVRDTIQRLVSFPERRGMATQVIWNGNDKDGFYTSHLVTGSGRHTQFGHLGQPTGRPFVSRTIADCMILRNKIYREWVVADTAAIISQLGLDLDAFATRFAKAALDKGQTALDIGENGRLLGQYPPEAEADVSLANNEIEADTLRWLHEVFNKRMFGKIKDVYAPTVQYHGPMMKELYGVAAVTHQHLGLVGSLPDAAYMPQHICSVPSEEGGTKVAVRWLIEGHHLGYGILQSLGEHPTGKRVQVMGMTHYHYKNGKIADEWNVYDELSLLTQVKLAQLADIDHNP